MRAISRNSAWNFAGLVAPLPLALVAVPRLVAALGDDAFGLLALGWSLIGYFSLLDLGLGRALSQATAAHLAAGRESRIAPCFWTALFLMTTAGAAGAAVLVPLAGWAAERVLHVPATLASDARSSLALLAASIPVLTATAALRGYLEGQQRFRAVSAVRMGMGVLTFALPVLLLGYSRRVTVMLGALVGVRAAALVAYFALSLAASPGLWRRRAASFGDARALLRFGSWMTVSNVVSPLMVYLDRFLIGAILSVGAVAWYVTPFEAASKLLLISSAVTGVLFPAFSGALVADPESAAEAYRRALTTVAALLALPAAVLAVAGRAGLALWLGPQFAGNTGHVLPILALGMVMNGTAGVPFALIQAAGRPDLTAKLHLAEAPVFLALCWGLTLRYGIEGAAWAWTLRATADAAGLLWIARRWTARAANTAALAAEGGLA